MFFAIVFVTFNVVNQPLEADKNTWSLATAKPCFAGVNIVTETKLDIAWIFPEVITNIVSMNIVIESKLNYVKKFVAAKTFFASTNEVTDTRLHSREISLQRKFLLLKRLQLHIYNYLLQRMPLYWRQISLQWWQLQNFKTMKAFSNNNQVPKTCHGWKFHNKH